MKNSLCLILFAACFLNSFGQSPKNYAAIDARSESIGFFSLQELTKKLIQPYTNEEDKARAIFAWIANHISYDYKEFKHTDSLRYSEQKYSGIADQRTFDSLQNFEYANFALKNHRGICSEYSALFKVMCNIADLQCEIVTGYGKWPKFIGNPYESNHAWNAVFINNTWKLIDVTWAYGGLDISEAVLKKYNPFYFFTPAELFINNHYPDKIEWSLLPLNQISRMQFEHAIYYPYEEGGKIKIETALPKNGLIKKKMGDSISFEVITNTEIAIINLSLNDTVEVVNYQPLLSEARASRPVEIKPISAKEAKTVDALFDYIDAIAVDSFEYSAKNGAAFPDSVRYKMLKEEVSTHYFKKEGNKYSFKYHIKKKGDYMIWISINFENVMAYRLIAE